MILNRNLVLLFCCQLMSVCASMVMVTLGGVIGTTLAASPTLATLPLSLMVIGTASSTIPAALIMKRIGRRLGFSLAALVGAGGTLVTAQGVYHSSFAVFCAGLFILGFNLAFVQQYRFAAAESVEPHRVGGAISIVLLGSIGGALIGPVLVARGQHWFEGAQYLGTIYALTAMLIASAVLLLGIRNQPVASVGSADPPSRTLHTIVRQPVYLTALLGGVVAYGVMSFIMTATPVSMHIIDGHGMDHTAGVVRSHVIAMYAPSLISGYLIARVGVGPMMAIGALTMLGTVLTGLQGQAVMHYWLALVLLGVGWNFLYVGGTTLLTRTYQSSERFRAQAVNDFSVFACSAAGSLLAGTVIHLLGWVTLLLTVTTPLLLMLLALYGIRGHEELRVRGPLRA